MIAGLSGVGGLQALLGINRSVLFNSGALAKATLVCSCLIKRSSSTLRSGVVDGGLKQKFRPSPRKDLMVDGSTVVLRKLW